MRLLLFLNQNQTKLLLFLCERETNDCSVCQGGRRWCSDGLWFSRANLGRKLPTQSTTPTEGSEFFLRRLWYHTGLGS
ncbi:hypothetical protein RHMOL_Rhmol03G0179800 [Rhododendron molle]|uniref:Uncharacterized protein n=1 Tax=Rhododendron molle TaxID=49168 RepID=A0ACC0PFR8_RHOML|nr:hypothetical protein RHMOL_Rhmol03G0179800 [Rhododendron molle]